MKLKPFTYSLATLLTGSLLGSCWHEDLSRCWKGDVVLSVTAECFATPPDGPSEADFGSRIGNLQYYLFDADGKLTARGNADGTSFSGDHYDLVFPTLPFGDYTLALTANTDGSVRQADAWNTLTLESPETSGTDYFTTLYNFRLDCECGYADFVKLYRAKGIVEVRLEELPSSITRARVDIGGVSAYCLPDTTYQGSMAVWGETPVTATDSEEAVTLSLDAFPTPADSFSEVTLTLYMTGSEGTEIVASRRTLTDRLQVVRNQLTGIRADFNHSITVQPDIQIVLNPDWDGVNGDTDIDID